MKFTGNSHGKNYYSGFHTNIHVYESDTRPGVKSDPDKLAERLKSARAGLIRTDTKGHPGIAHGFALFGFRIRQYALWIGTMLAGGVCLASAATPEKPDPGREALKAYAAMSYTQAGKLAKQIPDTPEGQLVSGLCDLYDRSHQNIARGQQTLSKLFYNDKTPLSYRAEAGVALGRTVQLMKERRDLYGVAADRYDHIGIFNTVRKLAPGSRYDRDAFFYLMRERLEDSGQSDAAFKDLEDYFRDFRGDKELLPPLHLLAEYEYIRLRRDYRSAVRHLAEGYGIGFANPNENRSGLFRLAFLCYKKLNDKPMAVKYFNEYLTRYPYSGQAVVAKRFLQELGEDGADK